MFELFHFFRNLSFSIMRSLLPKNLRFPKVRLFQYINGITDVLGTTLRLLLNIIAHFYDTTSLTANSLHAHCSCGGLPANIAMA